MFFVVLRASYFLVQGQRGGVPEKSVRAGHLHLAKDVSVSFLGKYGASLSW